MVKHRYTSIYVILVLLISIHLPGCQKVREVFIKPPPEGLEESSYTIRLIGYQQTISINATPDEFGEFLNDPSQSGSIMQSGPTIKGDGKYPDEEVDPARPGLTFPVKVNVMGFEIPGTLVVVRIEGAANLWVLWDNPYVYQMQRWENTPEKDGTSLTFKFETEIPSEGFLGNMVNTFGFMGLADGVLKDVDMMMASIQAYFDPSLDPKQLVSFGLRGEQYEAVLQAHEAQVWVNAPPDKVYDWMRAPENVENYLRELKMEKEDIRRLQEAPLGEVIYSQASIKAGAISTGSDLFAVKRKKGKENILRLYYTLYDKVGFLELNAEPEAGGTMLTFRIAFELPESVNAQDMEVLLFATGIPKLLRERVLMVKQGVEGTG